MFLLQKNGNLYDLREISSLDELIKSIKTLPLLDLFVTGAHPDDEAFTFFYQLQAIEQGKKVGTVIVTDGAGMNFPVDSKQMRRDDIIALRNKESTNAAQEVGIDFLLLFNYPSSYLRDSGIFNEFKVTIEALLGHVQPEEILTHSPYDDHLTHLLVAEAVVMAAKQTPCKNVRGYPVWGSLLGSQLGLEPQPLLYIPPQFMLRQSEIFRRYYPSQIAANDYPTAAEARGIFQRIMHNAHQPMLPDGYVEFFVDYKPLTTGELDLDVKRYAAFLQRLNIIDGLRKQNGEPLLTKEQKILFANLLSYH